MECIHPRLSDIVAVYETCCSLCVFVFENLETANKRTGYGNDRGYDYGDGAGCKRFLFPSQIMYVCLVGCMHAPETHLSGCGVRGKKKCSQPQTPMNHMPTKEKLLVEKSGQKPSSSRATSHTSD